MHHQPSRPLLLLPILTIGAVFAAAAPTAWAAPASKSEASTAPTNDEGGAVSATKGTSSTRVVVYGDDDITGEVLSPTGSAVSGHIGRKHKSLIGIRGVFISELVKLSNDI